MRMLLLGIEYPKFPTETEEFGWVRLATKPLVGEDGNIHRLDSKPAQDPACGVDDVPSPMAFGLRVTRSEHAEHDHLCTADFSMPQPYTKDSDGVLCFHTVRAVAARGPVVRVVQNPMGTVSNLLVRPVRRHCVL